MTKGSFFYEKGLGQGLEQGLEQGLAKGGKQRAYETAKAMLMDGFAIEKIAQYTGLDVAEVKRIKTKM
jgi:predicted transposase/invertase (TIGR01784 family)